MKVGEEMEPVNRENTKQGVGFRFVTVRRLEREHMRLSQYLTDKYLILRGKEKINPFTIPNRWMIIMGTAIQLICTAFLCLYLFVMARPN